MFSESEHDGSIFEEIEREHPKDLMDIFSFENVSSEDLSELEHHVRNCLHCRLALLDQLTLHKASIQSQRTQIKALQLDNVFSESTFIVQEQKVTEIIEPSISEPEVMDIEDLKESESFSPWSRIFNKWQHTSIRAFLFILLIGSGFLTLQHHSLAPKQHQSNSKALPTPSLKEKKAQKLKYLLLKKELPSSSKKRKDLLAPYHLMRPKSKRKQPKKDFLKTPMQRVMREVNRNNSSIKLCYEKYLKEVTSRDRLKIKLIIRPQGSVLSATIMTHRLKGLKLTKCIRRRILRWHFSKFKGRNIKIIVPYKFSPADYD